jgi:hypothetical protein
MIVAPIYIINSMERLDVYQIKSLYPVVQDVGFMRLTRFFCTKALLLCPAAYLGDLSNVSISKYS